MSATKRRSELRSDDLALVERLANDAKLIAILPGGTAKPRRVAVASLDDGDEILRNYVGVLPVVK
jgi:hypothetical protein